MVVRHRCYEINYVRLSIVFDCILISINNCINWNLWLVWQMSDSLSIKSLQQFLMLSWIKLLLLKMMMMIMTWISPGILFIIIFKVFLYKFLVCTSYLNSQFIFFKPTMVETCQKIHSLYCFLEWINIIFVVHLLKRPFLHVFF